MRRVLFCGIIALGWLIVAPLAAPVVPSQLLGSAPVALAIPISGPCPEGDPNPPAGCPKSGTPSTNQADPLAKGNCGSGGNGVTIALPFVKGGTTCVDNSGNGGAIVAYLKAVLEFLGGAIGLIIILMITIAGTQYITSLGDPKRVASAKNRLTNAIIALVLYLMMFAILNLLVPGGLF